VDPVEQFAFVVGLVKLDRQTMLGGGIGAEAGNVGERFVPVSGRFARSEQIQIGTVEYQNAGRHGLSLVVVTWLQMKMY